MNRVSEYILLFLTITLFIGLVGMIVCVYCFIWINDAEDLKKWFYTSAATFVISLILGLVTHSYINHES